MIQSRMTCTRSFAFDQSSVWIRRLPVLAKHRSLSSTRKRKEAPKDQTAINFSDVGKDQSLDDWLERLTVAANDGLVFSSLPSKPLGDISVHALGIRKGGITIGVKLFRSKRGNSLNSVALLKLRNIFDSIAQHKSVNGVCFLPSQGSSFCGGADISEMSKLTNPHDARIFIRKISDLCNSIRNVPVPVVALIHGPCIGAGLEVAASCDLRVGTETASFSMPEVLVHLPSVVQARLLCDIVGWGRARHLMYTGSTWTAEEAFQAGLVTKLFQTSVEMQTWANEYMAQLNDPAVRNQYRAQKQLFKTWETRTVEKGIEAGVKCFADHFSQAAVGESIAAASLAGRHKKKDQPSSRSLGALPRPEKVADGKSGASD